MNGTILQNGDIIHHVLSFLGNDGTSVVRFSLCCKELYDQILLSQRELVDPNLWKCLVRHRWKRTRRWPAVGSSDRSKDAKSNDDVTMPISYRDLYIEKRRADAEAIRQLKEMASVLQSVLRLDDDDDGRRLIADDNPHVGQAWDHYSWKSLLGRRLDYYDIMKATAARDYYFDNATTLSVRDRLLGFLAASCVQDFNVVDCLCEWKQLLATNSNGSEDDRQSQTTRESQLKAAYLLERYSLLVCDIQKTPLELLRDGSRLLDDRPRNIREDNSFEMNQTNSKKSRAATYMDEIATVCIDRIREELGSSNPSVTAKLRIVNDVFANDYGFSGNSNDYYDYRNVLLDRVLESKTGMPITLCVAYGCICRRLGIPVQLTGLPGHIVLGFDATTTDDDDDDGTTNSSTAARRRSFIDVFHGCRILSSDDCRQIVASYGIGWRDDFLTPLSTKMTLHRIFNNLRNCHEKAMGTTGCSNEQGRGRQQQLPLFCSELMFQQNTLAMVHCYPSEIAITLLERLIQSLSIVLSPDLLLVYDLLPPRELGIESVENDIHA